MPANSESICVVVADAARARIHTLGRRRGQGGRPALVLRESASLDNPSRRELDSKIFTDSRPGLRQGVPGGAGHGVDDHRRQHLTEMDRQFAAEIVERAVRLVHDRGIRRVVVAASPNMLGLLRTGLNRLARAGATVDDLAKDLTKLSPTELHRHLAAEGLLPESPA